MAGNSVAERAPPGPALPRSDHRPGCVWRHSVAPARNRHGSRRCV